MSSSSSSNCLTSRRSIEVDFDSHKFSVEMACEIINILPVRWRWWWSCIAHNPRNNSHLTERYLICVLSWDICRYFVWSTRVRCSLSRSRDRSFDIPIYSTWASSCFGEVDNCRCRAQALRMTTENCKQDVSRSCQHRSTLHSSYNDSSTCHPSGIGSAHTIKSAHFITTAAIEKLLSIRKNHITSVRFLSASFFIIKHEFWTITRESALGRLCRCSWLTLLYNFIHYSIEVDERWTESEVLFSLCALFCCDCGSSKVHSQ